MSSPRTVLAPPAIPSTEELAAWRRFRGVGHIAEREPDLFSTVAEVHGPALVDALRFTPVTLPPMPVGYGERYSRLARRGR